MQRCEKCGAPLVPGENWYALKADQICCSCNSFPVYYAKPRQGAEIFGDYENAILERQERYDC